MGPGNFQGDMRKLCRKFASHGRLEMYSVMRIKRTMGITYTVHVMLPRNTLLFLFFLEERCSIHCSVRMSEGKTSNSSSGSLISKQAQSRGMWIPRSLSLGTAILPQNLISTVISQTLLAGCILPVNTCETVSLSVMSYCLRPHGL